MRFDDDANRIPPLADAMLIDFVSGLSFTRDQVNYRSHRTAYKRIWDSVVGAETERQNLIDQNLVENQDKLFQQALWLTQRQAVTDTGLRIVADKLLNARKRIRSLDQGLRNNSNDLQQLETIFDRYQHVVDSRLSVLEADVSTLKEDVWELRAREKVRAAIDAWAAERTYKGIPWLFQVQLLAAEVVAIYGSRLRQPKLGREATQLFVDLVQRRLAEMGIRRPFALNSEMSSQLEKLRATPDGEYCLVVLNPRRDNNRLHQAPLLNVHAQALETALDGEGSAAAANAAIRSGTTQRVYRGSRLAEISFEEHRVLVVDDLRVQL